MYKQHVCLLVVLMFVFSICSLLAQDSSVEEVDSKKPQLKPEEIISFSIDYLKFTILISDSKEVDNICEFEITTLLQALPSAAEAGFEVAESKIINSIQKCGLVVLKDAFALFISEANKKYAKIPAELQKNITAVEADIQAFDDLLKNGCGRFADHDEASKKLAKNSSVLLDFDLKLSFLYATAIVKRSQSWILNLREWKTSDAKFVFMCNILLQKCTELQQSIDDHETVDMDPGITLQSILQTIEEMKDLMFIQLYLPNVTR